MKTLGLGLAAVVLLTSAAARAAPPNVCTDAYDEAQVLRKQGKLVAARDQLRVCSRPTCPGLIVTDCTQWTDEVQASLPSVVPVATDEAGANLVDVRVSIDGAPLANAPAGQAVDLDPGTHHFAFERDDLSRTETDVLVAVGQKNKLVMVTLRKASARTEAVAPASSSGSPLKTVGFVVAAAGVVGIGVGAGLGIAAISKQSASGCPNNVCRSGSSPDDLRSAGSDADFATAFFIAGGVLAAAGVTTWILAPSRHPERSAWLRPVPLVTANGGGLVVSGGW